MREKITTVNRLLRNEVIDTTKTTIILLKKKKYPQKWKIEYRYSVLGDTITKFDFKRCDWTIGKKQQKKTKTTRFTLKI